MLTGGCHCGAIRYEADAEPIIHVLCHCTDCQRASGAPMVGWVVVNDQDLVLTGEPAIYASSLEAKRYFCIQCGTGLFFSHSGRAPGKVDIQAATLDDPGAVAPVAHIHVAERISWMDGAEKLPHYPGWSGLDAE